MAADAKRVEGMGMRMESGVWAEFRVSRRIRIVVVVVVIGVLCSRI
jgi:hypothetical protein